MIHERPPDPTSKKLALLDKIANLIARSHGVQDILASIVVSVAETMEMDVCSVYLLDESGQYLTLAATRGLDTESVGKVRLSTQEGLTGLAIEKMQTVTVRNAPLHPRYKYFPETQEEKYSSFLATPIILREKAIGVLTIQTKEVYDFTVDDTRIVTTIASLLGTIIQNSRLLDSIDNYKAAADGSTSRSRKADREGKKPESQAAASLEGALLRGLPASPGVAMGRAVVTTAEQDALFLDDVYLGEKQELERLRTSIKAAENDIKDAEARVAEKLSDEEAKIFSTHLMFLEDPGFIGKIEQRIAEGKSAPLAIRDVVGSYVKILSDAKDPYAREKVIDIEDVGRRLITKIVNKPRLEVPFNDRYILVSHLITPSDAVEMDPQKVVGMISGQGGPTSHAAILARSMEIPAVVGIEDQYRSIRTGDYVILDGNTGNIHVNPRPAILKEFRRVKRELDLSRRELDDAGTGKAKTTDGERIQLLGNLNLVADLKLIKHYGAEGVGLYRTEFLFLMHKTFPAEEEQFRSYSRVAKELKTQGAVIRILDVGGDKFLEGLNERREDNPYLGWRSIRVLLDLVHVFKVQLRAIFRASSLGKVSILLPMVTTVEEIRKAKAIIEEVKQELRQEGVAFDKHVPVGAMIEVPTAVLIADALAAEADFLSIGSNDLTQYALAVDRNNQRVAKMYDSLHPSVLKLIKWTVEAGGRAGKPVSICGEMGADLTALPVLIGLGLTSFSIAPPLIPVVRYLVKSLSAKDCRELAAEALTCSTAAEVRKLVGTEISRLPAYRLTQIRNAMKG
ncbi:MAG: phosphoenolpyruvate--protein phosphotransferase [Deltaproteobacteria bacterium]|nr:phosphoenolpyruvate--protein phosphotransferase [Deltaproteobacteria bacterium]